MGIQKLIAADIWVKGSDIYYQGSVIKSDYNLLKSIILNNPHTNRVVLHSGGGSARTGMQLGKLIRKYGLETYVPKACHSACNHIFAGGFFRDMHYSASLGLHSFGYTKNIDNYYTTKQLNGLLQSAFNLSLQQAHHYLEMGISIDVVLKMSTIPIEQMYYMYYSEAKRLNFVNK